MRKYNKESVVKIMGKKTQLGAIPLALCDNTNVYTGSAYNGRFGNFTADESAIIRPAYHTANNYEQNRNSFYGDGVNLTCTDGLTSIIAADAICLDVYNYIVSVEKTSEGGIDRTRINIFRQKISEDTMEIIDSGLYDTGVIKPSGIGFLCYNTELREIRFIAGQTYKDSKILSFSESKGLSIIGNISVDFSMFNGVDLVIPYEEYVMNSSIMNKTYSFYNRGIYTRTDKTVAQTSRDVITYENQSSLVVNDLFNGKVIILPVKSTLIVPINSGEELINSVAFNKAETNDCLLLDIRNGVVNVGIVYRYSENSTKGVMMITDGKVSTEIEELKNVRDEVFQRRIAYNFSFENSNRHSINTQELISTTAAKFIDGQWKVYCASTKDLVECTFGNKAIENKLATGLDVKYNYDESFIRNICDNTTLDIMLWGISDNRFTTAGSNKITGKGNAKYYESVGIINSKTTEIRGLGAQEKIWVQRGEKWRCSKEGSAVYFEVNPENQIRLLDYISTEGTVAPIDCYLGLIAGRGTVMITRQSGIKFKDAQ